MENVVFILGDYPLTQLQAVIGGGVLAGLVLVVVLIVSMRNNARRAAEAADQLAAQVRTGFIDQLAERDRRIGELDHQVRVERERGADLLDREREKGSDLL